MKKLTWLLAGIGISSQSYSQVLYAEGFESYPANEGLKLSDGWGFNVFNEDGPVPAPRVRLAKDGITPARGSKMLEYRNRANQGRTQLQWNNAVVIPASATKFSFSSRILIAPGDHGALIINITPDNHTSDRAINLDLQTSEVWLGDQIAPLALSRSRWYLLETTMDYGAGTTSFSLDGLLILKKSMGDQHRFAGISMLMSQRKDVSSMYSLVEGAPGVFFDDVRITAVPEPISGISLATALAMLMKRRMKRS